MHAGKTIAIAAAFVVAPLGFAFPQSSTERVLSVAELNGLYSDKTWLWSDGGGYFNPNGTFIAAVGHDAPSAFLARGTWQAGPNGEMCFQALWNGQSGKNVERTCFYHKVANGRVLQRKGTAGEWYKFRSVAGSRTDESAKLIPGNRIASKIADIRSRFLYGVVM